MKNLAIISLILLLLMGACATQAEAKSKSFTIKVSCIVPERLELTNPATIEEEEIKYQKIGPTSSKLQTQETRIQDNQKTIIYTIVER